MSRYGGFERYSGVIDDGEWKRRYIGRRRSKLCTPLIYILSQSSESFRANGDFNIDRC